MTKILIDEAVLRQALEDFVDIKYGLEKSRIWGGMDWTYNPMHPVHYLPLRDKADVQISALHQALADAALDTMADNARELGLTYDASVAQIDTSPERVEKEAENEHIPTPPECKTEAEKTAYAFGWYKALESVREEKEPDPDELTIAYMSGLHEGKKIGAKDSRNKLATWMMQCGFATGHGDTLEDLLCELDTEVEARLAAKEWVDLTVTEQNELCRELGASRHQVRAIVAKLKEKNT